jgi:diguanylate cyclase (GGDEF)-like protein
MGSSALEHTRHLLGVGRIRKAQNPAWWSGPKTLSRANLAELNRSIVKRAQQRGVWRVPSTFTVLPNAPHPLLVMLEPLRATASGESAIIGVFDVKPLLEDFFASNLPLKQPAQLLERDTPLFSSSTWVKAKEGNRAIIVEQPVVLDAARWTLQLKPFPTRVVQTLSWVNILFIGLCLIAGAGVTIIVWLLAARTWILQRAVARRTAALRRTTRRLHHMATTDELTGLHNRRFFLNRWEWEYARAKRYQRPLACLMIDVDGFKQVNDRLGHEAGDVLLKQVAQELKALMRQSDILARFGGDEFTIALPETTFEQAAAVAEKLRQVSISVPEGKERVGPIRLSVGISQMGQDAKSPQTLLQAADQSLYASRRHGAHDSK